MIVSAHSCHLSVPVPRRSEQQITRDKETENITTYTLLGKSAEQVDDFISAAYDSYRAMLKGEQRDKTADRWDRALVLSQLHGTVSIYM